MQYPIGLCVQTYSWWWTWKENYNHYTIDYLLLFSFFLGEIHGVGSELHAIITLILRRMVGRYPASRVKSIWTYRSPRNNLELTTNKIDRQFRSVRFTFLPVYIRPSKNASTSISQSILKTICKIHERSVYSLTRLRFQRSSRAWKTFSALFSWLRVSACDVRRMRSWPAGSWESPTVDKQTRRRRKAKRQRLWDGP
jgi:hypothetical protein